MTVNERGLHDSTVVVVGDLHGQFHDMVFLMNDVGLPSEKRFYVFNGDYVDRGAWGLEVFIVLLAWKVWIYTSFSIDIYGLFVFIGHIRIHGQIRSNK